jgi:hypothetical protein
MNGLLSAAGGETHQKVVSRIVESAKERNLNIGYNSSWTINPIWRHQPELKSIAKELSIALFTSYYLSRKIDEILIGGVMKYKVDKIQAFLGFKYLENEGVQLPPIETWFVKNEKTILMHLTQFSQEALNMAQKYEKLWNQRMEITGSISSPEKVAA